ncbi:MAG: S8 family serine peptidase [candidate division Zixibacteria bacterium]|nr:S8 family serine peptidase [candidate division Zixibacteria bacterium]
MRVKFITYLVILCALGDVSPLHSKTPGEILGPTLLRALEDFASAPLLADSTIEALVFFEKSTEENSSIESASTITSKFMRLSDRRFKTLQRLTSYKSSREESALEKMSALENLRVTRRFWITRSALVTLPISQLNKLTQIDGVSAVRSNFALELISEVSSTPAPGDEQVGPRPELVSMNIPALWLRGLTGKGRIVASFDTGVDGRHPDLVSRFRGVEAGWSAGFYAPNSTDTVPFDAVGHGTHTMGLMVGASSADSFGVAPGATWMTAAVVDQGNSLNGTIADLLSSFQWALNPDGDPNTTDDVPDVILNSWGIPAGLLADCDQTFWEAIDNTEAAGIVTIFAAGNEGPEPSSMRSPADRITSPLNSFSVGAISIADNLIANFSSRGPSLCDGVTIKPEVVAPGVNVYSTSRGGGYGFKSGSSMAAPYIAGLVALLRQYNPNITVEQIKQAILGSCTDLGPSGADNSYGQGLPDALLALKLAPPGEMPEITFVKVTLNGARLVLPGAEAELITTVASIPGSFDTLSATLRSLDPARAAVLGSNSTLLFSPGNGEGINLTPFRIILDTSLVHGDIATFSLNISIPFDTGKIRLEFELVVGAPPPGNIYTHTTSEFSFTVSDFGQFGLAKNSAYSSGGEGFRIGDGPNLLYEAGIIVGRNELQLVGSIRDSNGVSFYSDFAPQIQLELSQNVNPSDISKATYTDTRASISVPITIGQTCRTFSAVEDAGFAILEFTIRNHTTALMTNMYFGYFSDFDINQISSKDSVSIDLSTGTVYQYSAEGTVAVSALTGYSGIVALPNGVSKKGFTRAEKLSQIQIDSVVFPAVDESDFYFQLNFGPFDLAAGDSFIVPLAIAVGADPNEASENIRRARNRYLIPTDVNDGDVNATLPNSFELSQNYPNPFNPSTTISYSLPRAGNVRLSVLNILGQEVRELVDSYHSAGSQSVIWDGKNSGGQTVASGIYFYRLESESETLTRKMAFLK